jgi:hypothetical protein
VVKWGVEACVGEIADEVLGVGDGEDVLEWEDVGGIFVLCVNNGIIRYVNMCG